LALVVPQTLGVLEGGEFRGKVVFLTKYNFTEKYRKRVEGMYGADFAEKTDSM
jgi:hypothetical protein